MARDSAPPRPFRPQKKRPLFFSRLARLIFFSNLAGLVILIAGATAMNRFQDGLIASKVNNLRTQAGLMTSIMGDTATGYGVAAELDEEGAREVLRRVDLPDGWRVRLHSKSGQLIADSARLDDEISVAPLAPLPTEPPPPPTNWERLKAWGLQTWEEVTHNLPWRVRERDANRRDLVREVRAALEGETVAGPAYDEDDQLVVSISTPVKRVQNVLGVLTLESDDVEDVVTQEREALLPIIAIAFGVALLSSLALTWSIARPIRKLARAAETVAKSSDKRDAVPDLSRRRDDIGDLSVRMREMSEGLYDRIDDVANFAADVAHEIKNPLTSLRSASDTLSVARTDEQRAKLIGIIQQDVGRMDRLISDISAASRVDADLARERAETVDVARLAGNLIDFYDSTTPPDAPRVRYFGPGEGELFIRAFETPFAQVLRNLIDNAITFSPPGGEVRITADAEAENGLDRVILTVDDDGPGLPEDALETVFERFYTDRTQQAQAFGSHSGLGLTICRQIVHAHKGRIRAENRRSGGGVLGARFVITLPRVTRGGGPSRPSKSAERREERLAVLRAEKEKARSEKKRLRAERKGA